MTPDERAREIRALCAIAKWPGRDPSDCPRDFDADPGLCPGITSALVEDYITRGVALADIRRELLHLTARADERIGEIG
jgi:hypothetical protein